MKYQVISQPNFTDGQLGTKVLTTFPFNLRRWTTAKVALPQFQFGSVLYVSDNSLTASLSLFNIDDNEQVGTALTTSSVNPILVNTTINIGDAPNLVRHALRTYEVRLAVSGGSLSSDRAFSGVSFLRLV